MAGQPEGIVRRQQTPVADETESAKWPVQPRYRMTKRTGSWLCGVPGSTSMRKAGLGKPGDFCQGRESVEPLKEVRYGQAGGCLASQNSAKSHRQGSRLVARRL